MENAHFEKWPDDRTRYSNSAIIIALVAVGFSGFVMGIWVGALLFAA